MPQNQVISIPINSLPFENTSADTEYIILQNIYNSADNELPLRQRELAQIAGTSLGMTNSILKRLAQKGWITIKKLNSRNIQYAVTLEGINEIIHRSYRYFKRTISNVVYYKDILEEVIYLAKRQDLQTVVLLGSSDLDFIVEHACLRWRMSFVRISEPEKAEANMPPEAFIVCAESIPESANQTGEDDNRGEAKLPPPNIFYLSRLIMKQVARAAV